MLDRRNWSAWLKRIGRQAFQAPDVAESVQQVVVVRDETRLQDVLVGPTGRVGGHGASGGGGPTRLIVGAGPAGAWVDLVFFYDGAIPEKVWSRPGVSIEEETANALAVPGTQITTQVLWQGTQRGSTYVITDELTSPFVDWPTWGFEDDGFGVPVAHLDKGVGVTAAPVRWLNYWIEPNCSLYTAHEASSVEWGMDVREGGAIPQ